MNNISIGLMAHVDAGKTTLSEALLYRAGTIRKIGRVDHRDTFLDTNEIERQRGITVFSKEARFSAGENVRFTLLDTPGHADFSCEMERCLRVLDYAVLVISGSEGVQSHTMTLWKLLKMYKVPTVIFVNKMDMQGADRLTLWNQMKVSFGGGLFEVEGDCPKDMEELSLCTEEFLDAYLEDGLIPNETIAGAIAKREAFPVLYGSALKMEGVDELLSFLGKYIHIGKFSGTTSAQPDSATPAQPDSATPSQPDSAVPAHQASSDFSAIVYKISRDKSGNRQTHMKITGGTLKSKMLLSGRTQMKVEQIRLYNGNSFDAVQEASCGEIVAVTGLSLTYAGQIIGDEEKLKNSGSARETVIMPALTYRLILAGVRDNASAMRKLAALEEESPNYHFAWDEEHGEIHVSVMGDLELEVLKYRIKEKLDLEASFDQGSIIYKETIRKPVIGTGHYEPLRHYAEVRLLLEPLPCGSGLQFASLLSEDTLARNWQRLIMTHLTERRHKGALTNSELTDLRISIVGGKASNKHTEGGDFRKATYRAIRQGLRKLYEEDGLELLEPVYSFTIEVPSENIGRVMTDMQRLGAKCEMPDMSPDGTFSIVRGTGPVESLRDYQLEINTFARGKGRFMASLEGYRPCHNTEAVLEKKGYDPDTDARNLSGSVFCEHGAGVYVDWDKVDEMAHTVAVVSIDEGDESCVNVMTEAELKNAAMAAAAAKSGGGGGATDKELSDIFEKTYGKSKREEQMLRENKLNKNRGTLKKSGEIENFPMPKWKSAGAASGSEGNAENSERRDMMVVDGYNVIFAWEELNELAKVNIDSAREALLDILENYSGFTGKTMKVVFDGYKLPMNPGSVEKREALDVVYTKEGETADNFIEKFIFEHGKKKKAGGPEITVVSSDRLVQMTTLGDGALRLSAREFFGEVAAVMREIKERL